MLMIRQLGQDILNTYALDDYHLTTDGNRNLQIQDDNGNVLLSPNGIQFSKSNPTKKEINYSLELLDNFLSKHFIIIKAYLDKLKAFRLMEKPKEKFDKFKMSAPYKHYGKNETFYTLTYTDKFFKWSFKLDTKVNVKPDSVEVNNNFSPNELKEYNFDEQYVIKKGLPFAKEFIAYNEEKLSLERHKKNLFKKEA